MRKSAFAAIAAVVLLSSSALAGPAALVTLADLDDLGLGARWSLTSPIDRTDLALSAQYFVDGEYFAVDGDLHFVLSDPDLAHLYPLVGLQLATDFDGSDLGLGLGAGYEFSIGRTPAFVEGKFVLGDIDVFAVTLGLWF